jgi:hypothetical protein
MNKSDIVYYEKEIKSQSTSTLKHVVIIGVESSILKLKQHCDKVEDYIDILQQTYDFDKEGSYYIEQSIKGLDSVCYWMKKALEHTDDKS